MRYFCLICLLFLLSISFGYAQPKREIRSVWLSTNWGLDWPSVQVRNDRTREKQKQDLLNMLDELEKTKINVVLFQTRLRGDVLYPSEIEPWNAIATGVAGKNPGYDILDFAVKACHERGMECHAWIVCMPIGSARQMSDHKNNALVKRHPELCKFFNGEWYLNPAHPGTSDYLSNIANEIVTKYNVDGIHLDYIRYPENAKSFPDKDLYKKYGNGMLLNVWRRNNINKIVTKVYDRVKAVKPWVQVSSSPLGRYNNLKLFASGGWSGYESVYQDAQSWLKHGKQDFVAPMMYYKDHLFYPFLYDWVQNSNARPVVSGLGAYRMMPAEGGWKMDDILAQVDFGRHLGSSGQAYFRAKNLLGSVNSLSQRLSSSYYSTVAMLPAMTWIKSIAPDTPSKFTAYEDSDKIKLTWANQADAYYYTVYKSNTPIINTNDPKNIYQTKIYEPVIKIPVIHDEQDEYYCVTASDRYHNESNASKIISFCLHKASGNIQKTVLSEKQLIENLKLKNYNNIEFRNSLNISVLRASELNYKIIKTLSKGFYLVHLTSINDDIEILKLHIE